MGRSTETRGKKDETSPADVRFRLQLAAYLVALPEKQ
jgi:hypothetical protein